MIGKKKIIIGAACAVLAVALAVSLYIYFKVRKTVSYDGAHLSLIHISEPTRPY